LLFDAERIQRSAKAAKECENAFSTSALRLECGEIHLGCGMCHRQFASRIVTDIRFDHAVRGDRLHPSAADLRTWHWFTATKRSNKSLTASREPSHGVCGLLILLQPRDELSIFSCGETGGNPMSNEDQAKGPNGWVDGNSETSGDAIADEHPRTSFTEAMERWSTELAKWIEIIVRLISYIVVLLGWFFLGGAAYIGVLAVGIPLLIATILLRLITGLSLGREMRVFFSAIRFFPAGFTELSRSLWGPASVDPHNDITKRVPYFYSTFRLMFVVAVVSLEISLYYRQNPFVLVASLDGGVSALLVLLLVASLSVAVWNDLQRVREPSQQVPKTDSENIGTPNEESTNTQTGPNPIRAESWTG
jgi:hypothetical protein